MEKERRTKALLLSTLVVVVATLSIAFAAMSRTLSINGIGKMDTASWSVYFNNLGNAKITRGALEVGKPKISDDKGTVQDINVKLSNPKDEISYTVDIVNDGTIDAEITMIKDIELTDVQRKVFEFKVTYTDTGEVLKDGDLLPAGDTKNITINIKFRDDITEFDLPTESQTINLSYQITYTQYDGDVTVGPNSGEVEGPKSILASANLNEAMSLQDPSTYHVYNGTLQRKSVESITFLNSNVVPTEYESTSWDASDSKDGSVMAWYTDSDTNGLNEVYIGGNGKVYAPSDSSVLLAAFMNLKELNFNNNFDTSDVINMTYMFAYCPLTSLDLSSFNTQKVTHMTGMFVYCSKLINLNINSLNTENVTDMYSMFSGCSSLTNLNVSNFNTNNVNNMDSMFYECESLTSLDVSSFNTTKVTDMSNMFTSCTSLSSLDLDNFDTSNVTNMNSMFYGCSTLTSLDLSSFDTSSAIEMIGMFAYCSSLTKIDLRNADFSDIIDYGEMFYNVEPPTQVIVKDETQRALITAKYYNLTNVVLPSEL